MHDNMLACGTTTHEVAKVLLAHVASENYELVILVECECVWILERIDEKRI